MIITEAEWHIFQIMIVGKIRQLHDPQYELSDSIIIPTVIKQFTVSIIHFIMLLGLVLIRMNF